MSTFSFDDAIISNMNIFCFSDQNSIFFSETQFLAETTPSVFFLTLKLFVFL